MGLGGAFTGRSAASAATAPAATLASATIPRIVRRIFTPQLLCETRRPTKGYDFPGYESARRATPHHRIVCTVAQTPQRVLAGTFSCLGDQRAVAQGCRHRKTKTTAGAP